MIDPLADLQPEKASSSGKTRQSKFAVDVLKLASGTTLAQVINVLASPVLARLFAPEAFGIFALFTSMVGILVVISTLQFELALMLPEDDADAVNLLAGSLGIATVVTLVSIPIIWLSGPTIAAWLNAPQLVPYLWLLPVLLFFGGIGAGHPVLNSWSSRTRHFTQISASQVTGTLSSTFVTLSAGFAGFTSAAGLIGGNMVGSILSPLLLGGRIWRQDRTLFLENVSWSRIWENLKRYRKFAIFNTPSALLNTISWQVPSFLLAAFFSPVIVGYYAFGNQLLRVPMNLIGGSIAQAFYAHASTARHQGNLADFVEATFRRLVEYGFLPILILAMIGRDLCVVIFGDQWAEAGVYIQILSPWMFFWFISSPMSRLYSVLEKNELSFRINLAILISRVLSVWVGGVLGDPRLALALFSVSGVITYGYLSFTIVSLSGVSWLRIARIFLDNILLFVPMGILLFILKMMGLAGWVQLLISALLIGSYFLYRFHKEGLLKNVASTLLKKKNNQL